MLDMRPGVDRCFSRSLKCVDGLATRRNPDPRGAITRRLLGSLTPSRQAPYHKARIVRDLGNGPALRSWQSARRGVLRRLPSM